MTKQVINIGSAPNDNSGDPDRTAWTKTNSNFTELYNGLGGLTGTAQGQIAYYNGTAWVVLGPGTAGYVLQTGGASANPSWVAGGGGGGGSGTVNSGTTGQVAYYAGAGTAVSGAAVGLGLALASGTLSRVVAAVNGTYGATTTINADTAEQSPVSATGDLTLTISATSPTEGKKVIVPIFANAGSANVAVTMGAAISIPTSFGTSATISVLAATCTWFSFIYSVRAAKWVMTGMLAGCP